MDGVKAFQNGDFAAAREAFTAAYSLSSKAAVLYNLAQAEFRLGEVDSACSHLQQWIDEGDPPSVKLESAKQEMGCP